MTQANPTESQRPYYQQIPGLSYDDTSWLDLVGMLVFVLAVAAFVVPWRLAMRAFGGKAAV